MKKAFDIDGVITIGIHPGKEDLIITGRSFEEAPETEELLERKEITNQVYYSNTRYAAKTRDGSARFKAQMINALGVTRFFEDDPVQIEIIQNLCHGCKVVQIISDLVPLENRRNHD